jgi:calcium-dependent protein kinase
VHRDLKPENILLSREIKDPKITIIDFGTSGIFDRSKKMTQKFGTPYYIAPEVLNNNYDEKCDLWSIGVILYILLCGYPPFNGANDDQIIKKVKAGKFRVDDEEWEQISDQAIDLVHRLLESDPNKRISASEALQHDWILEKSVVKIDNNLARKTLSNLKNFSVSIYFPILILNFREIPSLSRQL